MRRVPSEGQAELFAQLDAFAHEPPEDGGWFALDNVALGSCAASTGGATRNMGRMATENLLRDLQ